MNNIQATVGDATQFYQGHVPPFAEMALETLYGSLYASLPQLSLDDLDQVSTYTDSDDRRWSAIFLYTQRNSEIRVINEGMTLQASDIERFAQQMFRRDRRVSKIRFHAIRLSGPTGTTPSLHLPVTEDIAIDLPADEAAYIASLGKSTRKTLRQNQARASSLLHKMIPGAEVDAAVINTIIGFNHARMAGKQRASALDARASAQLFKLIRARGMVSTVSMRGVLCAGTLACRFGDDVFSLVNAHDPAVDHLGMGNISRHLMILEAIRRGAKRFHLLGGHFASKRSCGARRIALEDVTLYRNRIAMLADIAGVIDMMLRSANYRIRVRIEDSHSGTASRESSRFVVRCIRRLRDAVHMLRGLTIARH